MRNKKRNGSDREREKERDRERKRVRERDRRVETDENGYPQPPSLCVYATTIFLMDFFFSFFLFFLSLFLSRPPWAVIAYIACDMGRLTVSTPFSSPATGFKCENARTLYATYVMLSSRDEHRSDLSQFIFSKTPATGLLSDTDGRSCVTRRNTNATPPKTKVWRPVCATIEIDLNVCPASVKDYPACLAAASCPSRCPGRDLVLGETKKNPPSLRHGGSEGA